MLFPARAQGWMKGNRNHKIHGCGFGLLGVILFRWTPIVSALWELNLLGTKACNPNASTLNT